MGNLLITISDYRGTYLPKKVYQSLAVRVCAISGRTVVKSAIIAIKILKYFYIDSRGQKHQNLPIFDCFVYGQFSFAAYHPDESFL